VPDGSNTDEDEERQWAGAGTCEEVRLRVKVAEFRARQAHEALEEASAYGCCLAEMEALERAYPRAVATCQAAWEAASTRARPQH
jgi:hypothetical protein